MSRRFALSALLLLVAVPLHAQDLRTVVSGLFRFGTCPQPLCLNITINDSTHGGHFVPSLTQGSTDILGFLADAIGASVSNVPLSATSSGATFSFEGGLPVKTSVSSGPVFGERAQTLGRGRFLIGTNVTNVAFQSVRGVALDAIVFDFKHDSGYAADTNPLRGNPTFENDIFEVRPRLDINLSVGSLFMTYGLLDRVDIGVAVPVVRTSISGVSVGSVLPFGPNSPHFFDTTGGKPRLYQATSTISGTATGIGDIAARIKINLTQSDRGGFALLLDARFPTGDENNFLGSGHFAIRGLGVWSARLGAFSPHGNAGYLSRGGGRQNDAVLTTVGFDQLLAPWATMAVDVVGQWEVGASRLQLPGPFRIDLPTPRIVQTTNIPNQHDHVLNGSMGFKFDARGLTIVTNALVPLRKAGLQSNFIWTVGVERNF